MLDKPEQTARLVAMLKAAVPFDVELLPSTQMRMQEGSPQVPIAIRERVFEVTYEPSHGGIICLIRPEGTDNLVATSLTHLRVRRTEPFASAVTDYQKHPKKKIRQKRANSAEGF